MLPLTSLKFTRIDRAFKYPSQQTLFVCVCVCVCVGPMLVLAVFAQEMPDPAKKRLRLNNWISKGFQRHHIAYVKANGFVIQTLDLS